MADRSLFSDTSLPQPTGPEFLAQYFDRGTQLFNASIWPLSSVGGTGDAVTAVCDPPLLAGLVSHMRFTVIWAAANTGGMTLSIGGGPATPVLGLDGSALTAGAVGAGLMSLIEYDGSAFRILSPLLTASGGGSARYFWQFTSSGTWVKPTGLDDDTRVFIEVWGAGGGGSSNTAGGGGGGGGWIGAWFRLGDLPSSVSVTIGAGGAVNSNGGSSSFGSLLRAYPGLGASGAGAGARGGSAVAGGLVGAGLGATTPGNNGQNASTENGGGGGGAGDPAASSAGNGGAALRGGGAGGGRSSAGGYVGTGGASVFGGNGGDGNVAGSAPGGGGGRNAAGARGEVRVWI